MLHGRIHIEPLQLGLFAGNDDVDAVAGAQAMIGNPEQRVCIGRQIHPDDRRLFVHDEVEKPRVLMAESVVVLPPHVRREQVIERCNRPSPGYPICLLEPLGVLIEHRIDNVHERFVA